MGVSPHRYPWTPSGGSGGTVGKLTFNLMGFFPIKQSKSKKNLLLNRMGVGRQGAGVSGRNQHQLEGSPGGTRMHPGGGAICSPHSGGGVQVLEEGPR